MAKGVLTFQMLFPEINCNFVEHFVDCPINLSFI